MARAVFIIVGVTLIGIFAFAERAGHPRELAGERTLAHATTSRAIEATKLSMDWKSFTKLDDATLRSTLTPIQYDVTQKDGTEPAFNNEYWRNVEEGIYVDVVSGEPLFSSKDKYDSGTGWPSFTKPLNPDAVVLKVDSTLGVARTEVRSKLANSHLGHLFEDGPAPLGTRYCMNSASLRFIPKAQLEAAGYGEFVGLFK